MQLNGLGDTQVIGGLVAIIIASYAAFFTWVVASINRLDRKIDTKIDALDVRLSSEIRTLDERLSTEIKALDGRLSTQIKALDGRLRSRIDALSTKIDSLTVAVARLERAVWGRVPVEPTQGRG